MTIIYDFLPLLLLLLLHPPPSPPPPPPSSSQEYAELQERYAALQETVSEQEIALVEMGKKLSR